MSLIKSALIARVSGARLRYGFARDVTVGMASVFSDAPIVPRSAAVMWLARATAIAVAACAFIMPNRAGSQQKPRSRLLC